ncbi:hypothetical protein [Lactobacillus melliventris]|uniref:DUF4355 domain-containing protein n=1 Tax=Lactobacillus melliventris TaxID=1218507 RepID=A0ABX5MZT0_9LACO|nr:hypothetical protein [Lactobacillus melliventris]MBC6350435.1 hypothetical protein [Lactobacillus melliventris]PXY84362.1 hypothetical protein DK873_04200 [Lactobacillus melliventris]
MEDKNKQVTNQENGLDVKKDNAAKTKGEATVTEQIEKMRRRIDRESSQKNQYKQQLEDSQKQIETLTEKLKSVRNVEESKDKKNNNLDLDKAISENEKLKAQLIRRDQMDTVSQQFSEAGVVVPKDMLNLVVPAGIDEKQVSANMKALSSFYDTIVKQVKKEFLKSETPRVNGNDNKPFDRSELRKIDDPVKRVQLIKEHLDEF